MDEATTTTQTVRLFETAEEEIAALRRRITYWSSQVCLTPRREQFVASQLADARERLRLVQSGEAPEYKASEGGTR